LNLYLLLYCNYPTHKEAARAITLTASVGPIRVMLEHTPEMSVPRLEQEAHALVSGFIHKYK